jgi:hypothetical protein
MALTKERVQDKVEIVKEWKHIQVRFSDNILEDGNIISHSYHREMILCGDYAKADELGVRAIADAVWTADLISEYEASINQPEIVE